MTWTAIGSEIAVTGTTFTFAPSATGNIAFLVVTGESTTVFANAITSSNATWTLLNHQQGTVGGFGTTDYVSVFQAVATGSGSATATIAWSGTTPGTIRGGAWVFHSSVGSYGTASTTLINISGTTWPASGTAGLYFGYAYNTSTQGTTSTSGFTSGDDGNGNPWAYNLSATTSSAPVFPDSSPQLGYVVGIAEVVGETTSGGLKQSLSMSGTVNVPDKTSGAMSIPLHMSGTAVVRDSTSGGLSLKLQMSGTGQVFPTFPTNPLGLKVEILINGTWEDITSYVYQREDISITRGLPNETQAITPAQMTLILNNRDGRFSPKNSSGAYYPYLVRNTQVRVSVNAASTTGVTYSDYRFWGEMSSLQPSWDLTGNDAFVSIIVSGPFRRYVQSPITQSPFKQALLGESGNLQCVALWPCEDGTDASQIASAIPGVNAMTYVSGTPSLAANTPMVGATQPLPTLNSSQWHGVIPTYTSNGNIVVRFLVDFADSPPTGDVWTLMQLVTTGPAKYVQLQVYDPSDYGSSDVSLSLIGYASNGSTVVFTAPTVVPPATTDAASDWNAVAGTPNSNRAFWVSMEIQPVSGQVQYSLVMLPANATTAAAVTANLVSGSVGKITDLYVNPFTQAFASTAVGMISVQSGWETMYDFKAQLVAFAGETAADRLSRLCSANGLTFGLAGSSGDTPQMGPQQIDTLLNQMQSCADMDRGQLYETRGDFGVAYRTRVNMQNQSPAVTASYTNAVLGQVPAPTEDDQYVRNYVTMQQANGGSATVSLASGANSILDPPNGAGIYQYQQTVIAYSDDQLPNLAQWVVDVATVDEYRFPQITFNMMRPEVANFFSSIPTMTIGDYFQITNPPSFLQSSTIKQLVWGYQETLNAFKWNIAINGVPESVYEGMSLPTW